MLLLILTGCKNEPAVQYAGSVTDVCGNTYNYVQIGEQYWLTENMRCNKYDTKSERAGITLSTSEKAVSAAYYADASNKSNWTSDVYAGALNQSQITQLGYLYNWAAAVGFENGEGNETEFSVARQGICPNGWHVPNLTEWITMLNIVNSNIHAFKEWAKQLKSSKGWYKGGNGDDLYRFSVLPAGLAEGNEMGSVGFMAYIWTATAVKVDITDEKSGETESFIGSVAMHFKYDNPELTSPGTKREKGLSVRCVRD